MLAACDIEPNRYGAQADPSLLGMDCAVAIRKSKVRTPDRVVHLEQRLKVVQAIAADEKLGVRAKIESDPAHPRWLTTVRGVGYRLEPDACP